MSFLGIGIVYFFGISGYIEVMIDGSSSLLKVYVWYFRLYLCFFLRGIVIF